jgi:hypothetical protein
MRALAIALLVATIALAAWGVGELHYRNCVNAAKAEGTSERQVDRAINGEHGATVTKRVAGCSRLP